MPQGPTTVDSQADSRTPRRVFIAAFGGNALDNFDFSLFSLLIPTFAALWGMSRGEAGLIASSTILAGSLGGALAGALADRLGRVRVLQWTILWFSLFTFLCGFAADAQQLLWLRIGQGIGFGGELAVGAVLIAESVGAKARGRVMGAVASGYAVGAIAATLAYGALFALLPPEKAWRWLFWAGVLPALFVLYIRRGVSEPPTYARARSDGQGGSLLRLLSGELAPRMVLGTLLVAGVTGAQNIFVVWLPTYLHAERGFSMPASGANYIANSLGALIGFLFGGAVIDRLGRRRGFQLASLAAATAVLGYVFLPISGLWLMPAGLVVGVLIVAAGVGATPFLTELFPTAQRGAATGFCYSVGRGLGALMPALVGWLGDRMALAPLISGLSLAAYAVVILAATALPETRGREL